MICSIPHVLLISMLLRPFDIYVTFLKQALLLNTSRINTLESGIERGVKLLFILLTDIHL